MIYGANGYTGRLIARHAVERGLKPVLAGRNREAVTALAAELGCHAVGFDSAQPGADRRPTAGLSRPCCTAPDRFRKRPAR